jgi:hypothetical protein
LDPERIPKSWSSKNLADVTEIVTNSEFEDILVGLPVPDDWGARINVGAKTLPYLTWDGAGSRHLLLWSTARRIDRQLETEFRLGAPDFAEQRAWLDYHSSALLLAAHVDAIKSDIFRAQLVRQLTAGNPIGIHLCVRSLVEHLAVCRWMVRHFGMALAEIQQNAHAGQDFGRGTEELEKSIRKFLAGQTATSPGEIRSWATDASDGQINEYLRLSQVVADAFPEHSTFGRLYKITSAAMHSRLLRGIELTQAWEYHSRQAERLGVSVLDALLDYEEDHSTLMAATAYSTILMSASNHGGTATANCDAEARHIMGFAGEQMISDRDYTGSGTYTDPFILNPRYHFHIKSYDLLFQLGIDNKKANRRLSRDANGKMCDLWSTPNREYWFQITNFPNN